MKLIIGASSGLGLKLAFLLAYKGFDLIICSSNIEDLKKIKSHIENIYGVKVHLFELNLSDLNKSFEVYSENIKRFIPKVTGSYFIAGKTENNDIIVHKPLAYLEYSIENSGQPITYKTNVDELNGLYTNHPSSDFSGYFPNNTGIIIK